MRNEHCKMAGYNRAFTTGNYGVTTTPLAEYEISTGKRECSKRDMLDRNGKLVRSIQSLDELRDKPLCIKAELTYDEILAVVHKYLFLLITLTSNLLIRTPPHPAGSVHGPYVSNLQPHSPAVSRGGLQDL